MKEHVVLCFFAINAKSNAINHNSLMLFQQAPALHWKVQQAGQQRLSSGWAHRSAGAPRLCTVTCHSDNFTACTTQLKEIFTLPHGLHCQLWRTQASPRWPSSSYMHARRPLIRSDLVNFLTQESITGLCRIFFFPLQFFFSLQSLIWLWHGGLSSDVGSVSNRTRRSCFVFLNVMTYSLNSSWWRRGSTTTGFVWLCEFSHRPPPPYFP